MNIYFRPGRPDPPCAGMASLHDTYEVDIVDEGRMDLIVADRQRVVSASDDAAWISRQD